MNDETVLNVAQLSKVYCGRNKLPVQALDQVSFNIQKGELLGLLGPNGAGKTTIIKIICGLVGADSGQIYFNGINLLRNQSKGLEQISVILEGNRNIYWRLTAEENFHFLTALKGKNPKHLRAKFDYYINLFNLQNKTKETVRNLSRGMQQKLTIAIALAINSELILLDEPTLGLDTKASYEIKKLLKYIAETEKRTIILTTHDMNLVQEVCHRIVIIKDGRVIVDDKTHNLRKLFQINSYRIIVKNKLDSFQKESLQKFFSVQICERESDVEETVLTFALKNPKSIYQIINILAKGDSVIESIELRKNDFEKIYLQIIGEMDHAENSVAF